MNEMKLREGDVLVVVDVQNDFAHQNGSLYVQGAEKIFPVVRDWINKFAKKKLPILLTKDWHPPDHVSFESKENPNGWPPHCVQNTWGAEIPETVPSWRGKQILKGQDKDKDEYSGFAPKDGLGQVLRCLEASRIFVVGLATDYCVKATVLDALDRRFGVIIIKDGMAAVNIKEKDGENAIRDMRQRGASTLEGLLRWSPGEEQ